MLVNVYYFKASREYTFHTDAMLLCKLTLVIHTDKALSIQCT